MVEKGDVARLMTVEDKPSQARSHLNKSSQPADLDRVREKTQPCLPVDFKQVVCAFVLWE